MLRPVFRSCGIFRFVRLAVFGSMAAALAGCSDSRPKEPLSLWPYPAIRRVAVVPLLNFSGDSGLDSLTATDLLASELTQLGDITVVPVNRVLAALEREGIANVRSPRHAMELCRAVGSDAVIVPAITEYDPYEPMSIGLAMELYTLPEFDPDGQQTRNVSITGPAPMAQMQRIFDASQKPVARAVEHFGKRRGSDAGPFGWRRYLVTQEGFLRFCFAEGLRIMLNENSVQMDLPETTDG